MNMKLNFKLNETHLATGVTQSELSAMDDCIMKWNLGYNNLVVRKGRWNWAFVVGSALHDFFEKFYRGEGDANMISIEAPGEDVLIDSKFEEQRDYWMGVIGAMQRAYARKYADDLTLFEPEIVEEVVTREYRGMKFTGKLDLAARGPNGMFIMDHKTTSNVTALTEDGWDFRLQFQFYPWLLEHLKPTKFTINAIKKPLLRQTKTETHAGFVNRVAKDIATRPEEYFKRDSMPINRAKIKHFQDTILDPKISRFEIARKHPEILLNRNTNTCTKYGGVCEFLPICRNGWELEQFQYEKRENKHEELQPTQ